MIPLDFELSWLGSTAAEREGIYYDFSTTDHPAFVLNEEPKRLIPGYLNLVGIMRKIVSGFKLPIPEAYEPSSPFTKELTAMELGGEESYLQNCQTTLVIALDTLSLLFCIFINTTAYHLGRYEPSPPSTEELHVTAI